MTEKKDSEALDELLEDKKKILETSNEASEEIVAEVDRKIVNELKRKQKDEMNKEFQRVYQLIREKGKASAVFDVKERIIGGKKNAGEPHVIKHPKTGNLLFKPKEMKKASVQYCKELLTNRVPKEEFEEDLTWKRIIHEVRMKETFEDDIEFSQEIFNRTFRMLKKKGGKKYNSILLAGDSFLAALCKLYEVV